MTNYTPIDLKLFIREGDSRVQVPGKKRDGFDRLFFPFSILVLILSLSFYAFRLVIDVTGSSGKNSVVEPTKAPSAVMKELTKPTNIPSPSTQLYREIDGIRVNTDLVLSTAEAQYPSLSRTQLVDLVNKSLLEWATLRQYYEDDDFIIEKLSVQADEPIATFGAVLRDLGVLAAEYDKDEKSGQTPVSALMENFMRSSTVR